MRGWRVGRRGSSSNRRCSPPGRARSRAAQQPWQAPALAPPGARACSSPLAPGAQASRTFTTYASTAGGWVGDRVRGSRGRLRWMAAGEHAGARRVPATSGGVSSWSPPRCLHGARHAAHPRPCCSSPPPWRRWRRAGAWGTAGGRGGRCMRQAAAGALNGSRRLAAGAACMLPPPPPWLTAATPPRSRAGGAAATQTPAAAGLS